MPGMEIVLVLILVRMILPAGLILLAGEWMHRREARYRSERL
jgi:hypothetical protein